MSSISILKHLFTRKVKCSTLDFALRIIFAEDFFGNYCQCYSQVKYLWRCVPRVKTHGYYCRSLIRPGTKHCRRK